MADGPRALQKDLHAPIGGGSAGALASPCGSNSAESLPWTSIDVKGRKENDEALPLSGAPFAQIERVASSKSINLPLSTAFVQPRTCSLLIMMIVLASVHMPQRPDCQPGATDQARLTLHEHFAFWPLRRRLEKLFLTEELLPGKRDQIDHDMPPCHPQEL